MTGALLLAVTAGMLGAVNPCGFALHAAGPALLTAALAALLVLAVRRGRRRGPALPTPAVVARRPVSGPG